MSERPRILVGVCGSIAAYKAAELVRLLCKEGVEVRVVLTRGAIRFVSPLTFEVLSGYRVGVDMWAEPRAEHNDHVWLAHNCEMAVVAPCTAATLSRLATGQASTLLTATLLGMDTGSVVLVPAMEEEMWFHQAVQENVRRLRAMGMHVMEPQWGELASGRVGVGRLPEPSRIVEYVLGLLSRKGQLSTMKALVTVGATREYLDSVRFISNASSGQMGVAVARQLARCGAYVHLVCGSVSVPVPVHPRISLYRVDTAHQMLEKAQQLAPEVDIVVGVAAVADYMPSVPFEHKYKGEKLTVELIRTPDILATLAKNKRKGQVFVGFSLESDMEQARESALRKLRTKKLDLVVLNFENKQERTLSSPTIKPVVIEASGREHHLDLMDKEVFAVWLVNRIAELVKGRRNEWT